jgi:prepilin-type N-terminal cleavage/methylation domain-containing protein
MQNNKGFTLIEIIVAVALVAILSAAIAPSVINNIAQGRIARAQSDCQAIAQAISRFRSDVGYFPYLRQPQNVLPENREKRFHFLASNNGAFPEASTGCTNKWPSAFTTDLGSNISCEDFSSHLIFGSARGGVKPDGTLDITKTEFYYVRVTNPDNPQQTGFRSAVMSSDPADPWGNRYMCNIGAAGAIGQPVWIISAGPNGLLETKVVDNTIASGSYGFYPTAQGDDIGYRLQ